jgi:hypothetical protein
MEEIELDENGGRVCFLYPNRGEEKTYLNISLCDVRVADYIRISFDFDRDGWVIEQSYDSLDEETCEPPWIEVAFLPPFAVEE